MYRSTRDGGDSVDFTQAVLAGLAPDGGLFVPVETPSLPEGWDQWSYQEAVSGSLDLFGAEDVGDLVGNAASEFHHPDIAPIVEVGDRLVLELFHGPTLSFKDHALQVVTRLLDREVDQATILAATSGDTGSAAVEACRGRAHLRIVVLYPEGMVSDFQRRQMTTVADENVTAVAVRGTFDQCQAMVKETFRANPALLAVNSINWARIAAQVGYYVFAGGRVGEPFDVVVPTGNFGNVYSCWTAKQMGVPIETITISNNANHMLADLVKGKPASTNPVVPTLAPAMDIQVPSNLERFTGDPSAEFAAGWSTDDEIRETIAAVEAGHGYVLDPHTATAWRAGTGTRTSRPQLVVATAHPSKFGNEISSPGRFDLLFELPERIVKIGPDTSELATLIR